MASLRLPHSPGLLWQRRPLPEMGPGSVASWRGARVQGGKHRVLGVGLLAPSSMYFTNVSDPAWCGPTTQDRSLTQLHVPEEHGGPRRSVSPSSARASGTSAPLRGRGSAPEPPCYSRLHPRPDRSGHAGLTLGCASPAIPQPIPPKGRSEVPEAATPPHPSGAGPNAGVRFSLRCPPAGLRRW